MQTYAERLHELEKEVGFTPSERNPLGQGVSAKLNPIKDDVAALTQWATNAERRIAALELASQPRELAAAMDRFGDVILRAIALAEQE